MNLNTSLDCVFNLFSMRVLMAQGIVRRAEDREVRDFSVPVPPKTSF